MCSCAHNEAARTGREGVSFSSSGAVRGGQLGAGQVSMWMSSYRSTERCVSIVITALRSADTACTWWR